MKMLVWPMTGHQGRGTFAKHLLPGATGMHFRVRGHWDIATSPTIPLLAKRGEPKPAKIEPVHEITLSIGVVPTLVF